MTSYGFTSDLPWKLGEIFQSIQTKRNNSTEANHYCYKRIWHGIEAKLLLHCFDRSTLISIRQTDVDRLMIRTQIKG